MIYLITRILSLVSQSWLGLHSISRKCIKEIPKGLFQSRIMHKSYQSIYIVNNIAKHSVGITIVISVGNVLASNGDCRWQHSYLFDRHDHSCCCRNFYWQRIQRICVVFLIKTGKSLIRTKTCYIFEVAPPYLFTNERKQSLWCWIR